MYVTKENVERAVALYGRPREVDFGEIPMLRDEYDMLIGSMRDGRRHDATLFAFRDGQILCIQKQIFAGTGVYRAPSGAVKPGEALDEGLLREISEETGLSAQIEHFLLIVRVAFSFNSQEPVPWTSYVFSGACGEGEPAPRDKREIHTARFCAPGELTGEIADRMTAAGLGGFRYRIMLTRETLAELAARDGKSL